MISETGENMDAQNLFAQFLKKNNLPPTDFDVFSFGTDADLLADLVLRGKKTATSSAYEVYLHENTPLPEVGQYSVVLNGNGDAVCVICSTAVYVCAFERVAPFHAAKEGEGDGSLSYWRTAHEDYFKKELSSVGLSFTRQTPVVCEEFALVYPEKEDAE